MDGLIYASSMELDSARRRARVPALARRLLGLGIVAALAANVAHGLGRGIIGAAVAAWPAAALAGSYELLMVMIRGVQAAAVAPGSHNDVAVQCRDHRFMTRLFHLGMPVIDGVLPVGDVDGGAVSRGPFQAQG